MTDEELKQLVQSNALAIQAVGQRIDSNAKAIAALTSDIAEMKRDRDIMYQLMSELTSKQISTYGIMKNLDERQSQLANQQQQLIEIIKSMNK